MSASRSILRCALLSQRSLNKKATFAILRKVTDARGFKTIELTLKFVENTPAITGIERHSKPGRRLYFGSKDIPRVLGGLGVAIVTTSKGVVRARDARELGVGGELICKVW